MQPQNQNPQPIQTTPQSPTDTPPPQGPSHKLIGMTGSQLTPEKVRLPKGVIILTVIGALAFLVSFFDTSQNSIAYTIDMFLVLVTTIGLFLRLEIARKLLTVLSGVTVVLSILLIVGFVGLQSRMKVQRQRYDTAVAQLNSRSLSTTQKQQLDDMNKQLNTLEKQVGKSMQLTYIKYGLTIVAYAGAIVYLTRPSVKQNFRKDL
ncbi:MAG TPA: hypothetical protein VK694_00870 [Verrucomicrobiae bacterium]|nr:hypothetical protein [Verrucomicrobiae bacterium]